MRLHLMPLHNMEGSDDDDEDDEYEDDDFDREAAFTVCQMFFSKCKLFSRYHQLRGGNQSFSLLIPDLETLSQLIFIYILLLFRCVLMLYRSIIIYFYNIKTNHTL